MSETLTLYTRAGCPLCEDLAEEAGGLLEGSGHGLAAVDVDADPELKARFGWDVPLLFHGSAEICRHRLDPAALRAWLQDHP